VKWGIGGQGDKNVASELGRRCVEAGDIMKFKYKCSRPKIHHRRAQRETIPMCLLGLSFLV
jgi:hypothetical protein